MFETLWAVYFSGPRFTKRNICIATLHFTLMINTIIINAKICHNRGMHSGPIETFELFASILQ